MQIEALIRELEQHAAEFYIMRSTLASEYVPQPWTCNAKFKSGSSTIELTGEGDSMFVAVERCYAKFVAIPLSVLIPEMATPRSPDELEDEIPF